MVCACFFIGVLFVVGGLFLSNSFVFLICLEISFFCFLPVMFLLSYSCNTSNSVFFFYDSSTNVVFYSVVNLLGSLLLWFGWLSLGFFKLFLGGLVVKFFFFPFVFGFVHLLNSFDSGLYVFWLLFLSKVLVVYLFSVIGVSFDFYCLLVISFGGLLVTVFGLFVCESFISLLGWSSSFHSFSLIVISVFGGSMVFCYFVFYGVFVCVVCAGLFFFSSLYSFSYACVVVVLWNLCGNIPFLSVFLKFMFFSNFFLGISLLKWGLVLFIVIYVLCSLFFLFYYFRFCSFIIMDLYTIGDSLQVYFLWSWVFGLLISYYYVYFF